MKSRPRWVVRLLPSWPRTASSSRKATHSFVFSRSRVFATRTSGGATPAPPPRTGAVPTAAAESRLAQVWWQVRAMGTEVRLAWVLVAAALLLDVLLVGQHALIRYQAYHADAFDLGNLDQAVWNTLHGHPFRFTNRGNDWLGPPTRLGIH